MRKFEVTNRVVNVSTGRSGVIVGHCRGDEDCYLVLLDSRDRDAPLHYMERSLALEPLPENQEKIHTIKAGSIVKIQVGPIDKLACITCSYYDNSYGYMLEGYLLHGKQPITIPSNWASVVVERMPPGTKVQEDTSGLIGYISDIVDDETVNVLFTVPRYSLNVIKNDDE